MLLRGDFRAVGARHRVETCRLEHKKRNAVPERRLGHSVSTRVAAAYRLERSPRKRWR